MRLRTAGSGTGAPFIATPQDVFRPPVLTTA